MYPPDSPAWRRVFVATARRSFQRSLCFSISPASGIALGREGPNVKALVPVGCSAALAAAFNTPIAAVLFSLEEIPGDFHAPVLGSVVRVRQRPGWFCIYHAGSEKALTGGSILLVSYRRRSKLELLRSAVCERYDTPSPSRLKRRLQPRLAAPHSTYL
jgi:hypothetical protein